MLNKYKKAISPVVATTLLLLVLISSFVVLQGWFQNYSGSMFNEVDANANDPNALQIKSISGNTLYAYNIRENAYVKQVKIDGNDCNISKNLSKGVNDINITNCINLTTHKFFEVVLITNKGIFSKSLHSGTTGTSTLTNPTPTPSNPLCSDLSLLLHFDNESSVSETNNFFYDWSGSGNDGNLFSSGIAYTNSGIFDKGLEFDALDNDGRIEVTSNSVFNFDNESGMSVFLWFNKSTDCNSPDGGTETFVTRFGSAHATNTWWISCDGPSDKLAMGFYPSGAATDTIIMSPGAVDDGQWHLGGWVYDETINTLKLYLDGVLVNSFVTDFDAAFSSTAPLCIGAYGSVTCDSYEYSGMLDELSIWNRSLSDDEVLEIYNLGSSLSICD